MIVSMTDTRYQRHYVRTHEGSEQVRERQPFDKSTPVIFAIQLLRYWKSGLSHQQRGH